MKVEIKTHKGRGDTPLCLDDVIIGYFEQMTVGSNVYSFMVKCPHDTLTGDHYIAIGEHLNKINQEETT